MANLSGVGTLISNLTESSSFAETDVMVRASSSGTCYKITWANIVTAMRSALNKLTSCGFKEGAEISNAASRQLLIKVSGESAYQLQYGVYNDGGDKWMLAPKGNASSAAGGVYLGSANHRFASVYAYGGTINTSDRRLKKDIEPIKTAKDFIMAIKPVSYRFKTGDEKVHYGMIAQDIEEMINRQGFGEFAGLSKEPSIKDGKPTGDYEYGLAYAEFIAPLIAVVQEQQREIEALKQMMKDCR